MHRILLVIPLAMAMVGCAHKKPKHDEDGLTAMSKDGATNGLDCSSLRVHFNYDSSELSDEDKTSLQDRVGCVKSTVKMTVLIEGNTDERGTEEYNLALGDRRALSVSKYMQALGADPVRLRTVSFGEEKPMCDDAEESCWKQNRRAAVKLATKSKND